MSEKRDKFMEIWDGLFPRGKGVGKPSLLLLLIFLLSDKLGALGGSSLSSLLLFRISIASWRFARFFGGVCPSLLPPLPPLMLLRNCAERAKRIGWVSFSSGCGWL